MKPRCDVFRPCTTVAMTSRNVHTPVPVFVLDNSGRRRSQRDPKLRLKQSSANALWRSLAMDDVHYKHRDQWTLDGVFLPLGARESRHRSGGHWQQPKLLHSCRQSTQGERRQPGRPAAPPAGLTRVQTALLIALMAA